MSVPKETVVTANEYPNPIGEIRPEHPIGIDSIFRRISLYLDSADLISCSQVWWNCYYITKEIFEHTDNLTVPSLQLLSTELAKATKVQNVGHLTLQSFGHLHFGSSYEDIPRTSTPEILVKLLIEHQKLKYLNQLTINYPRYGHFNLNIFHYLMRSIGQRLQTLYIKVPYGNYGSCLVQAKNSLFPIYSTSSRENAEIGQLLEYKNMKTVQLYWYDVEIGITVSIVRIALTFPNLVELYLKGVFAEEVDVVFGKNVDVVSKRVVKPAAVVNHPASSPQLCCLRILSIMYEHIHLSRTNLHLTILTSMELQLRQLELVNVSRYAYADIVMEFLETQAKTLEVLKLTTTYDARYYPPSFPGRFLNFFLPGEFLKLEEITLGKVFVNDRFKETLKAISNATKITFQLMPDEVWGSIFQRTNLSKSYEHQPTTKEKIAANNAKTKNSNMPQAKPKKPGSTTTYKNIKEIYITGGVKVSKRLMKELKQVFPNCVPLNSTNI